MNAEITEKDLSFKIMKAAFEVHNQLGPGFSEKIYEEAMTLQLSDDGMELERQKSIKVYYKDRLIGEYILDLLANNSYLKATGLQLAIVINFGAERVQYSRVVNTKGKGFPSTTHKQAHKPNKR